MLFVVLLASRAQAQASCVALSGELPASLARCAPAPAVCESYQRALAADGGSDLPQQLQVRLSHPEGADAAHIELALDAFSQGRPLGQRTLSVRSSDCAALPDALALVLVLLAREAPAPVPTFPPPAAADDTEPGAPVPPEQTRAGRFGLSLGAGAFFGTLPSAALGLSLQAALLGEPLSLRARASVLWPQTQRIAEGSVHAYDYELAVEACAGFTVRDGPIALRLCAGPRLGLMHVRAEDFALQNERASEFLMYLGLMPEVSLALGPRTSLVLGAAAAVAVIRPRFGVGLERGARLSSLSTPGWLRAELGLSLMQIF